MRNRFVTALALGSVLVWSGACATKGYVQKQVAGVDEKVESMSKTLEETQQRTRANETRIAEVNKTAEAAGASAQSAQGTASAAGKAASAADAHAAAVETATKRLMYEVTLSEDQAGFGAGKTDLPAATQARIDQLIGSSSRIPRALTSKSKATRTTWVGRRSTSASGWNALRR